MTLVDTSSLVHFLRLKGDRTIKERVRTILESGEAALCDMIKVELSLGAGSRQDESDVRELCSLVISLPTNEKVWTRARELAAFCRRAGTPVPSSDLIIAACAFEHGAALDYEDHHFAILEKHR